ncbi:MAG: transporter [Gammaproteobacteria bacterium]|jgi:membrane fusion protein (multidrug efflux system)|nr:transporter [Gammaproteobacteria bacterium]
MKTKLVEHKKIIIVVVSLIVLSILAYWRYEIIHPSTDNAYVQANIINISSQISGRVDHIYVQNHQPVKAGDLLFTIDPEPFTIALEQAKAVVAQRTAEAKNAQLDSERAIKLAKQGVLSHQAADDAIAKIASTNAALQAAQADVDQAKLNLTYTKVAAPATGDVENFTLRVGDVLTANTLIFAIIDSTQWWVDANYNETDLERIRVGQPAKVEMDMYPSKTFKGVVESISSGSGATFSLLPPENATGNWVKITQRFPVRIKLKDIPKDTPPRVGASATVTINTN